MWSLIKLFNCFQINFFIIEILLISSVLTKLEDNKILKIIDFTKMKTNELIDYWGYPSESHEVQTEDGYILTNFRIPNPGGYPILFLHGLSVSSDCWFLRTPKEDIVFLLWKKGYDIWMWNARGNMYSQKHINFTLNDDKFYQFTFEELAIYDTAATIDYILDTTKHKNVITIGHSLGTSNIVLLESLKPDYKDKVKLNILWAQSIYLAHIKSKHMLETLYSVYERWMNFPYENSFFLRGRERESVKTGICNSPLGIICRSALRDFSGPGSEQVTFNASVKMMSRLPTGSSLYTIRQMIQNMRSGKFEPLSYGPKKNLEKYGTRKVKEYNIGNLTIPTAIYFACCNDYLSSGKDAFILKKKLNNVIKFYSVPYKKFNHGDFLWAKDSYNLLYKDVIELIDQYSGFKQISKETNNKI